MKKEKGFTLIELLAVIVILAILMVIAVPKILNVIENSKKSAAESSIKLVKDAIKTQVTSGSIMETNFASDESGCYTFNFDDQNSGNAKELQLKNKENITGAIKYCNGKFSDDTLAFNGIQSNVICKRATTLHTEKCEQKDTKYHCSGAGYTEGGSKGTTTITYGTLPGKELKSGDAFDCDVNGDGTYDENTERFYYVSDYYNTSTKNFEDDTAVLIFYSDVENGKPSNSKLVAYDLSGRNNNGPATAIEQLPSTSEWKNVSLKNTTRAILNEKGDNNSGGGPLPNSFSYAGKAARLLTAQEINDACNIRSGTMILGELDNFNYLFENTKYSDDNNSAWAWWLENSCSMFSGDAWNVSGTHRLVHNGTITSILDHGVRPVIEVPKSNIEY